MATAKKRSVVTRTGNKPDKTKDGNGQFAGVVLPKNFTVATQFGTNWDYLQPPHTIFGKVSPAGVRVVDAPDPNNKGKLRHAHKVSIINEDGEILDVWESASLKDWFSRLAPGQSVGVAYQGERPSRPGRAPLKMFVGGFEGDGLPPVNPSYTDYDLVEEDDKPTRIIRRAGPKR